MSIEGDWEISMSTPMGEQRATVTLAASGDVLSGKMVAAMGSEEFTDGKIDGDNLQWSVAISQPMPMTLTFNATINGDEMSGDVALGAFGKAPLSGKKV